MLKVLFCRGTAKTQAVPNREAPCRSGTDRICNMCPGTTVTFRRAEPSGSVQSLFIDREEQVVQATFNPPRATFHAL